jgi:quinol monooxygenase YgiN
MSPTALLISGRAKPGKRDALYALYLEQVAPHISATDAVRMVAWSADRDDEDAYHLFEIFSDEADTGSIVESDWFQNYARLAEELVAGFSALQRLETRWTKGL